MSALKSPNSRATRAVATSELLVAANERSPHLCPRPLPYGGEGDGRHVTQLAYRYSVWLRHLVKAAEAGLPTHFETVAELGPGDSLGTGLAALLTGARRLYALADAIADLDLSRTSRFSTNLPNSFVVAIRFQTRMIFRRSGRCFGSYEFPGDLLDTARLKDSLRDSRVATIRSALTAPAGTRARAGSNDVAIEYCAPWLDTSLSLRGSVDLASFRKPFSSM